MLFKPFIMAFFCCFTCINVATASEITDTSIPTAMDILPWNYSESDESYYSFAEEDTASYIDTSLPYVINANNVPAFLYADESFNRPIAAINPKCGGSIVEQTDTFYRILSGDYTGYAPLNSLSSGKTADDYLDSLNKTAGTANGTVCVYWDKELSGTVMELLSNGDIIHLVKEHEASYEILLEDGNRGFISHQDFIRGVSLPCASPVDYTVYYELFPERLQSLSLSVSSLFDTSPKTKNIVSYAMQFLGNPYVWGGNDLENGVDCSGFIHEIYSYFGYGVPRYSGSFRNVGIRVCDAVYYDENLLKPADILCYEGHVGLYIGDGLMIHAANEKEGIIISEVTYRNDLICVQRIIPDTANINTYSTEGLLQLHSLNNGQASHNSAYSKLSLSNSDFETFMKIVEAEAGTQGLQGKILVANVILNRVLSSNSSVENVVYARSSNGVYQFQPVANGKIHNVIISEETQRAVNLALSGMDFSKGAKYFMNPVYSDPESIKWFNESLTYLFTYKEHSFYK